MNYTSMKKRKSVSYSKDLEFPIDKVWSVISAPQNLENCHPFCKTNSTIEWHDQHHDVLQYLNGRKFYREFLIWTPMKGYEVIIGGKNGPKSYVIWELFEIERNRTKLKIRVFPYLLAKISKFLPIFPFWIKPRLSRYLYSVISGFEYYLQNGKPVPRNYFGQHPWFS